LIRERRVTPPGDETGTARVLYDELSSIGIEVKEHQAAPKRVNIEATPSGSEHVARFLFSGSNGTLFSTWNPVTSAYISEASTTKELNENVGTWQTLTALVRVTAPVIGGYLAQQWFPRAPYLVALFLVSVTGLYIQRYLKEPKPGIRAKGRGILSTR
jgi:hypothetical protein